MVSAAFISCLSALWLAHSATSTPLDGAIGRTGTASLVLRQENNAGSPTCLDPSALQTASSFTGQEEGTEGIKDGQAPSATNNANFQNFCAGQQLTNGMQITSGSCNGIPMGRIPATSNMISAIITSPQPGDQVPAGSPFNISVQTQNLNAGFFVNPTTNYYTAPQDLDENGNIIGHCHITVQDIGDLRTNTPPDPTTFAFFKGVDDAGNGQGLLQAVVDKGLPVGTYRVCTMIAARNHQPVNMPVAQRGAQDDCTKFQVVASGNGNQGSGSANQADPSFTDNQGDEGRVISDPQNGEPTRGENGTGQGVNGNGQQGGNGNGQQGGNGNGQGVNGTGQQGGNNTGQGVNGTGQQGGNGNGQGVNGNGQQGGNGNRKGGQGQGRGRGRQRRA